MEYLKQRLQVHFGEPLRRIVSTDNIEKYIIAQRGWTEARDFPDHFTERVRQAARRLVAIPYLSGEDWQVIAFNEIKDEENEGKSKWVQRKFAPERGVIFLSLVKLFEKNVKELEPGPAEPTPVDYKVHGVELTDKPEWNGRYYVDPSGSVHPIVQFWNERKIDTAEQRHAVIDRSLPFTRRPDIWDRLLKEQRKKVEAIMAQRVKDYGL
jgi:hypothetical protein